MSLRTAPILAAMLMSAVYAAQNTDERPDIRLVHVDAIASDADGRPVKDLQANEFEVIEGGESHAVESVRFVRASGQGDSSQVVPIVSPGAEEAEGGREGTRLVSIFLDEYHVSAGEATARVRAAITKFVDEELGPRDMVVVAKPLDSLPNLQLTRDREAIRAAIAGFDGRKGDLAPRTAFEQNYIPPDPSRIGAVRSQIVLSALSALAGHMGALNVGRKTLIVVSEGFAPPPRRRTEVPLPAVEGVARAANRSNVSIYPIDPRAFMPDDGIGGPGNADDAANTELLRTLARETDGHAILAPSDVATGLGRVVKDASDYYVIAFAPPGNQETGRFHQADIRVRREGVTLRTRTGYFEPTPDANEVLRRAAEPAPTMVRHLSPLIRPWFGMAPGDEGKTRVQFLWEATQTTPPGSGPRVRIASPSRASVSVLDARGEIIVQREVLPIGATGKGDDRVFFDLDPGKVTLHIQIEDASANLLDTDIRDLTVPAFGGAFALGTPQVFRARNARELRAIEADDARVPVIARQFSRSDSLMIRIPVHAIEEGTPVLTASLVSAIGGQMRALPVTHATGSEWHTVDVPLAGLAAGEYRVEYSVNGGGASGRAARDSLTFRVTP